MKNKTCKPFLLLLSVLLLATSWAAPARTFKIATISPDGTYWMKQMRAGAKEIKQRTQGRVKFKFYPGGVMGNDDSVMRKIRVHQLHGAALTNGALASINKDVTIYGLPFMFSSLQQSDEVRGATDRMLIEGLEKHGFVSFGIAKGGFTYMMSKQPIDSIEMLQQSKAWVPEGNEVGLGVYHHAGVNPVTLPLSDVLTGLQTNLIDTVITSPIGALALQWHTGVKYVVDLPLTYLIASLVIDKKAFDKLSEADRKVVREVMEAVYRRIDRQNSIDSANARQALINQGIRFIKLSDKERQRWQAIGETVRKEMQDKYHFNEAIYRKVLSQNLATR